MPARRKPESSAAAAEAALQNVRTNSKPSDLKITDLRCAVVASNYDYPLIRIDTNQGVYGLGEVRDAGHAMDALRFKAFLLGQDPTNVGLIFDLIERFGGQGREAGGISGIEMALWDLTGKVYGVPVYQFMGGKYRDKIRCYADTPTPRDATPESYARRVKGRQEMGYTWVKFDVGIGIFERAGIKGSMSGGRLTQRGIGYFREIVAAVRKAVGPELPLCIDHFGPLSVDDCIRLGNALEEYDLSWLEDMVPDYNVDGLCEITRAIRTPTLNGENTYHLRNFREMIERRAVRILQPDLETAGGIRETKRISDYGAEYGMPSVFHFAGSPIGMMANIHCAAATKSFLVLENHFVDLLPWWKDLVTGLETSLPGDKGWDGYVSVSEKPGLGVDLNEEVIREHLRKEYLETTGYFNPTDEWNTRKLGYYQVPGNTIGDVD